MGPRGLEDIERSLPFPLRGLDPDNGAAFIDHHLLRCCERRRITFTRSRPHRKNDNRFVEQKNWPVVRQMVGSVRYDTPAELRCLRDLYRRLRLYVNFFQPQMRLASKTRCGATLTKRYDRARTPYRRILEHPEIPDETKEALTRTYLSLNPAQLKREIARCQERLLELGRTKHDRKEVHPHPTTPSGRRSPGARFRGHLR